MIIRSEFILDSLFNLFLEYPDDQVRKEINGKILSEIESILHKPESFHYPFDSLNFVFIQKSADEKFKIYNWNVAFNDGSYEYYGFIQMINNNGVSVLELHDHSGSVKNPEYQTLTPKNWYGVLYYDIITPKRKKDDYYILLGWDGNDDFTTRKIIEVLKISPEGKMNFGLPIFRMGNSNKKRIIFEYSNTSSMTLRYDKREKAIIFDLLAPESALYEGKYEFYGPDGTYDGLFYKRGIWIHKSHIDIRNPKKK